MRGSWFHPAGSSPPVRDRGDGVGCATQGGRQHNSYFFKTLNACEGAAAVRLQVDGNCATVSPKSEDLYVLVLLAQLLSLIRLQGEGRRCFLEGFLTPWCIKAFLSL